MKDTTYSHKEKAPERDFYMIFHNEDGTMHYYSTTLETLMKFRVMYGLPSIRWSYTNHEADFTY